MKVTLHIIRYWSPSKSTPPHPLKLIGNPPPVLTFFNAPSPAVLKLFTLLPSSDWKSLLLHFLHMATSNKHLFIFLKPLKLIRCCHNWFLEKLKQYIKETRFYRHTFPFFMSDGLSFINTMQKSLKIFQKYYSNSQHGWEKISYPRISAEGYRQKTELYKLY